MKKIKLLTSLLILLSACGTTLTGYEFTTKATYLAPESAITLKAETHGKVEAGNDTGKGTSSGFLIFGTPADTLLFVSSETILTKLTFKGKPVPLTEKPSMGNQLTAFFGSINYPVNQNEITELSQIMAGLNSGPKGTYMQGQTKYISVVEVKFIR